MTLRIGQDGGSYLLSLDGDRYTITCENPGTSENPGEVVASGTATLVETRRGTYSVLFDDGRSIVVDVQGGAELAAQAGALRFAMAVSDPRDRRASAHEAAADGPREVRSQMPGKIIKLLVNEGETVEAGDGLLIIEAMKMQNEAKSPKAGVVMRVPVVEGATVSAGELLAVVE